MRFFIVFIALFLIHGCSNDGDGEGIVEYDSEQVTINVDHATDEIEFMLKRSIAGIEDLVFLYADNGWRTEELQRQLMEKIDELMLFYFENGRDMSELEKKLIEIDRQLKSLEY
tara:strand:- start:3650 stop:3991 length:342 start_codon:yes stop_codon:yes gene_type:complete